MKKSNEALSGGIIYIDLMAFLVFGFGASCLLRLNATVIQKYDLDVYS